MKTYKLFFTLFAIFYFNLNSIAQIQIDSSCNCKALFFSGSLGTSFPTASNELKGMINGQIGLELYTSFGIINFGGGYNFFAKPNPNLSNSLITLYKVQLGYALPFFKKGFIGVGLNYNKTSINRSSTLNQSGFGYEVKMGYPFILTKKNMMYSLILNYQSANLDNIDYSNIEVGIRFSILIGTWKKIIKK